MTPEEEKRAKWRLRRAIYRAKPGVREREAQKQRERFAAIMRDPEKAAVYRDENKRRSALKRRRAGMMTRDEYFQKRKWAAWVRECDRIAAEMQVNRRAALADQVPPPEPEPEAPPMPKEYKPRARKVKPPKPVTEMADWKQVTIWCPRCNVKMMTDNAYVWCGECGYEVKGMTA